VYVNIFWKYNFSAFCYLHFPSLALQFHNTTEERK
jgi:hypothetical protein